MIKGHRLRTAAVAAPIALGTGATTLLAAGVSSASAVAQSTTITVNSGSGEYASQAVLTFSTPLSSTETSAITQQVSTALRAPATAGTATPGATATPATSYYPISCSYEGGSGYYEFSDSNGTFGVRNNCSYDVFNWNFTLASYWQSVAVGDVTETGMGWLRNGVGQPTNAPHVEPPDYLFHGTLNPVYEGDEIFYTDHYDFEVDVDGNIGTASLLINGHLQATA